MTTYINKRKNINSLFGTYSSKINTNEVKIKNNTDEIADYIDRNFKTANKIRKNVLAIEKLNNPKKYYENANTFKNLSMKNLAKESRRVFIESLNRGMTQEEARKEMEKFIEQEKKYIDEQLNTLLI